MDLHVLQDVGKTATSERPRTAVSLLGWIAVIMQQPLSVRIKPNPIFGVVTFMRASARVSAADGTADGGALSSGSTWWWWQWWRW